MRILKAAVLLLCAALPGLAPAEAPPGRTVVTYWEKWMNQEGRAIQELVDDFNASQDKIWVNLVPTSAIEQKTLVAIAGGVPPDVSGLYDQNIVDYAERDALLPLDAMLAESGQGQKDYVPAVWDICVHKGQTWALPSTPASLALHYNRKLFREAGLDPEKPPRSIAELNEYAKLLTKVDPATGRVRQLGFLPNDPGWWPHAWGYFFGGRLWDGDRQLLLNSPENVAAFDWLGSYAQMTDRKAIQTFRSGFGNFATPDNPFFAGRLAMQLQGVWMSNYISQFKPGLEWAAAPFPGLEAGGPPVTLVVCDMLVIPRGARHPREAFAFISWLNRQGPMEKLIMLHEKISPLRKVSEDFYRHHKNPYIRMFQAVASSPEAKVNERLGVFQLLSNEMNAAQDRVWLGKQTAKESLDQAQARVQKAWDQVLERRSVAPSALLSWMPLLLSLLFLGGLSLWVARLELQDRRLTAAGRIKGKLRRGLLFALPGLAGLFIFTVYPAASALVYSFCDYSVLSTPRWVGLANFKELAGDAIFWVSLKNTFYYAALALPMGLLLALGFALLLDANVKGAGVYRIFFFLPVVTPLVANAMVWLAIFNPEYGVLNQVAHWVSFGRLDHVEWLQNERLALPSLVFMGFWGIGQTAIILMAALQEVPTSLYEAAELDGAGTWGKIRNIAVPAISPVLYFNLLMGIIGSLQVFAAPYIMTGGGPNRATYFYTMYLWDNAFLYLRMGYACAMALILFVAILALTGLSSRLSRGRVHYGGD